VAADPLRRQEGLWDQPAPVKTPAPLLNSPLRWAGGKSRLRRSILPLIPPHTCYAEPFGGGGWVLFGKAPSAVEVYNDLDGDLINFFQVLKTRPAALLRSFDWELVSRQRFMQLAGTDPRTQRPVERAHRFYYLLMAGWGGELLYPRFQTAVQDAGGGNRLLGALRTLEDRLRPVHRRLQRVLIEHLDWPELLEKYDSETTFFYVDPPYPGNGVNYRHNLRDLEDHRVLAEHLGRLKGRWMLSTYDRPDMISLYGEHHHRVRIQSASGMATSGRTGRVMNRELLICNFDPANP